MQKLAGKRRMGRNLRGFGFRAPDAGKPESQVKLMWRVQAQFAADLGPTLLAFGQV